MSNFAGGSPAVLQPNEIFNMPPEQLLAAAWPALPNNLKDPLSVRSLYTAPQPPQSDEPLGFVSNPASASEGARSTADGSRGDHTGSPTEGVADFGVALINVGSPTTNRASPNFPSNMSSGNQMVDGDDDATPQAILRQSGIAGSAMAIAEAAMKDESRHKVGSISTGLLHRTLLKPFITALAHNASAYSESVASSPSGAAPNGQGLSSRRAVQELTPNAAAVRDTSCLDGDGFTSTIRITCDETLIMGDTHTTDPTTNAEEKHPSTSLLSNLDEKTLAKLDIKKDRDQLWCHIVSLLDCAANVTVSVGGEVVGAGESASPARGGSVVAGNALTGTSTVSARQKGLLNTPLVFNQRGTVSKHQSQQPGGVAAVSSTALTVAVERIVALCGQFSYFIKQIQAKDRSQTNDVVAKDIPLLLTASLYVAALSTVNSGARDVLCHIVEAISETVAVGGDGAVDLSLSPSGSISSTQPYPHQQLSHSHLELTITKVLTPILHVIPMVIGSWSSPGGPPSASTASSERLAIALGALAKRGVFDPHIEAESKAVDVTFIHKIKYDKVVYEYAKNTASAGAGASLSAASPPRYSSGARGLTAFVSSPSTTVRSGGAHSSGMPLEVPPTGSVEAIHMPFAKRLSVSFPKLITSSRANVKLFHSPVEKGTLTQVALPPEGETVSDLSSGSVVFSIVPERPTSIGSGGMGSRYYSMSSDYGQHLFDKEATSDDDNESEKASTDNDGMRVPSVSDSQQPSTIPHMLSAIVKGEITVSVEIAWQVEAKKALALALSASAARLLSTSAAGVPQSDDAVNSAAALLTSTTCLADIMGACGPAYSRGTPLRVRLSGAAMSLDPYTRRSLLSLCRGGLVYPAGFASGKEPDANGSPLNSMSAVLPSSPVPRGPPSSIAVPAGISVGLQLLTMDEKDFLKHVRCRTRDLSFVRAMVAVAAHHLFGYADLSEVWGRPEWRECLRRLTISTTTGILAAGAGFSVTAAAGGNDDSTTTAAPTPQATVGNATSALTTTDVEFCPSQLSEFIVSNVVPLCTASNFKGLMSPASVVDAAVAIVKGQVRAATVMRVLEEAKACGIAHVAGLEAIESAIPQWPDRSECRPAIAILRNYLLIAGATSSYASSASTNPPSWNSASGPTTVASPSLIPAHYLTSVMGCGEALEITIRAKIHALIVKAFAVVRVLKRQMESGGSRRHSNNDTTAAHRYLRTEKSEGGIILSALSLLSAPLDRLDLASMCKSSNSPTAVAANTGLGFRINARFGANSNRDVFDNFSELLPVFSDFSRSSSFTISSLDEEKSASATLANYLDVWQQKVGYKNCFKATSQRSSRVSLELAQSTREGRASAPSFGGMFDYFGSAGGGGGGSSSSVEASGASSPVVTASPIVGGKRLMGYCEIKYDAGRDGHIRVGLIHTNDAKAAIGAEASIVRYVSAGKFLVPEGSCLEYPAKSSECPLLAVASSLSGASSAAKRHGHPSTPSGSSVVTNTLLSLAMRPGMDVLGICVVANTHNEHIVEYTLNGTLIFRYTTAATAKFLAIYPSGGGVSNLTVTFDGKFAYPVAHKHPCAFFCPTSHFLSIVALSSLNLLMKKCSPLGEASTSSSSGLGGVAIGGSSESALRQIASGSSIGGGVLLDSSQMTSIRSLLVRGEEALAGMLLGVVESVKTLPAKLGATADGINDPLTTGVKVGVADIIYSNILHQLLCCAKVTMAGFFYLQTHAATAAAEAAVGSGAAAFATPATAAGEGSPSASTSFSTAGAGGRGAGDTSSADDKIAGLRAIVNLAASLQPSRLVPVLVKILMEVPTHRRDIIAVAGTVLATAVELGYVVHQTSATSGKSERVIGGNELFPIKEDDDDSEARGQSASGVNAIVKLDSETVFAILKKLHDAGSPISSPDVPDGGCSADSGLATFGPSFVPVPSSSSPNSSALRGGGGAGANGTNARGGSKVMVDNPSMVHSDDSPTVVEMTPRVTVTNYNKELKKMLRNVGSRGEDEESGDDANTVRVGTAATKKKACEGSTSERSRRRRRSDDNANCGDDDVSQRESPVEEGSGRNMPFSTTIIRPTSSRVGKGIVATYSVRFSVDPEIQANPEKDLFGIGFATVEGFKKLSAIPRDAAKLIRQSPKDYFVLNNIDRRGSAGAGGGGGAAPPAPPEPTFFGDMRRGPDDESRFMRAMLRGTAAGVLPTPNSTQSTTPHASTNEATGPDTSNIASYDVAEQRHYRSNWYQQEKNIVYTDGEQVTVEYDEGRRTIAFFRNGMPLGKLYRNVGKGIGSSATATTRRKKSDAEKEEEERKSRTVVTTTTEAGQPSEEESDGLLDVSPVVGGGSGSGGNPRRQTREESSSSPSVGGGGGIGRALFGAGEGSLERDGSRTRHVDENNSDYDDVDSDYEEDVFELVPFIALYERQAVAVVQQPLLSPYYLRAQRLARSLLRSAPSNLVAEALANPSTRLFTLQALGADGDGKTLIRWMRSEKIVQHVGGASDEREDLANALDNARSQLEALLQLAQNGLGGGGDGGRRVLMQQIGGVRGLGGGGGGRGGRGGGGGGPSETRTVTISRRIVKLCQTVDDSSEVIVSSISSASNGTSSSQSLSSAPTSSSSEGGRLGKVPLALLAPDVNTCLENNSVWLFQPQVFKALVGIIVENIVSLGDCRFTMLYPSVTIRALRLIFDALVVEASAKGSSSETVTKTNNSGGNNIAPATATGAEAANVVGDTASQQQGASDSGSSLSSVSSTTLLAQSSAVQALVASLPSELFENFLTVLRLLTSIRFTNNETDLVSLIMSNVDVQRIQTWKVLGTLGPKWTASCRSCESFGDEQKIREAEETYSTLRHTDSSAPKKQRSKKRNTSHNGDPAVDVVDSMMRSAANSGQNDFILSSYQAFGSTDDGDGGSRKEGGRGPNVNVSTVSAGDISLAFGGAGLDEDEDEDAVHTHNKFAPPPSMVSLDTIATKAVNSLKCCRCNGNPWAENTTETNTDAHEGGVVSTPCDHKLPANDLELLCALTQHISTSSANASNSKTTSSDASAGDGSASVTYTPLADSSWSSPSITLTFEGEKDGRVSGKGSDDRGDFTFTGRITAEYSAELRLCYSFKPIAPSEDGEGEGEGDEGGEGENANGDSTEWACAACTFLNPEEARQCQICNTTRPGATWQCMRCTYAYNARDARRCEACGQQAPHGHSDEDDDEEAGEPYVSSCTGCGNKRNFSHPTRFNKMSYCSDCGAEKEYVFSEEFRATLRLTSSPHHHGDVMGASLAMAGSTIEFELQKSGPSVLELYARVTSAGLDPEEYLRIPSEVLKQKQPPANPLPRTRGGPNFLGVATVFMASRIFVKCVPRIFVDAAVSTPVVAAVAGGGGGAEGSIAVGVGSSYDPAAMISKKLRRHSPAVEVATILGLVSMNEEVFFEGVCSQLTPSQHELVIDALCALSTRTVNGKTRLGSFASSEGNWETESSSLCSSASNTLSEPQASALPIPSVSSPTRRGDPARPQSATGASPSPARANIVSALVTAQESLLSPLIVNGAPVLLPSARAFAALSSRASGASRHKLLYGLVWAALRGVWGTINRDEIRSLLVNNVSIAVDRVKEGANLTFPSAVFYCAPTKPATLQRLGLLLAIRSHNPSTIRSDPALSSMFVAQEAYRRMLQTQMAVEEATGGVKKASSSSITVVTTASRMAVRAQRSHLPAVLRENVFACAPTCVPLTGSSMINNTSLQHGQARGSVGVNARDKGYHYFEIVIPEDFTMRGRTSISVGWGTKNHELQGANTHVGLTNDSAGFDPSAQEVRMMGGQTQYLTPRPVVPGDVIGALIDLSAGQMSWSLNGEELSWISSAFGPTDVLYPYVSRNAGSYPVELRIGNTEYLPEGYKDFSATLMEADKMQDDSEVLPQPLSFYAELSQWVNELTNSGITIERILEFNGSWIPQGFSAMARFDSLKALVNSTPLVGSPNDNDRENALPSSSAVVASSVSLSSDSAVRMASLSPYVKQLLGFSNLLVVAGSATESVTRHYAGVKAQLDQMRAMMLSSARAAAIDRILSTALERDGGLILELTLNRERAKEALQSGVESAALTESITGQIFEAIKSRNVYKKRNMFTVKLADASGLMAQDNGGVYRSMISAMSAELMYTREAGSSDRAPPAVPLFKCNDHSTRFNVLPNPDILSSLHRDRAQQMFVWLGRMFGNAVLSGTTVFSISLPILAWKKLLGQPVTIDDYYADCNDSAKGPLHDDDFLLSDDYLYTFPNIGRIYSGPTDVQQFLAAHIGAPAASAAAGGSGVVTSLVLMSTPVSQATGGFPRVNSVSFAREGSSTDLSALNVPSGSGGVAANALIAKRERLTQDIVKMRRDAAIRSLLTEFDEGIYLIKKGLESVVPPEALREFTWEDLRRRVTGSVALTGEDVLSNAELDALPEDVRDMFRAAVLSLTPEMCGKLLQYCTGQDRLPVPEPIKVTCGDKPSLLPSSHTCSPISLTIQKYESVEKMLEMIARAVSHSGEFGLV